MKRKWKHRLSNRRPELMTADCAECGPGVRMKRKGSGYACRTARVLATCEENERHTLRFRHLMGTACEMCETTKGLVADVDSRTKQFRGTLCGLCNSAVGFLRDNAALAQKAVTYLTK